MAPSSNFEASPLCADTPPIITSASREGDANYSPPTFPIGPFVKFSGNPIITPNPANRFESAHIYNAGAIVLDDRVFLLYRAQDAGLKSSIGLAWSKNGYDFVRLSRPVLEASESWEAGGGVEDPRIVRMEDGVFYLTYTAWDLTTPRLCLATSSDLVHWKKYPPLFPDIVDVEKSDDGRTRVRYGHSKSGAIFPERNSKGRYMMTFRDSYLLLAESEDMINWTAKPFNSHFAAPLLSWENRLLEAGPSPIKTRDGNWILFYNAATSGTAGFQNNQYSIGQMLIDYENLDQGPLARLEHPSVAVSARNEREGLVNNVVFTEGVVQFRGRWFLYFGQGDSELGVATAAAE